MSVSKEELNIKDLYGKHCTLSKDDFLKTYQFNEDGLSTEESIIQTQKFGINEIKQNKSKKWYHYFLSSLFSPFNTILIGIAFVLIYTDIVLPESPSYANIIVIIILVLSSTLLDFFEEFRSNKAAEKLKDLVAVTTSVIRDKNSCKRCYNWRRCTSICW